MVELYLPTRHAEQVQARVRFPFGAVFGSWMVKFLLQRVVAPRGEGGRGCGRGRGRVGGGAAAGGRTSARGAETEAEAVRRADRIGPALRLARSGSSCWPRAVRGRVALHWGRRDILTRCDQTDAEPRNYDGSPGGPGRGVIGRARENGLWACERTIRHAGPQVVAVCLASTALREGGVARASFKTELSSRRQP